MHAHVWKMNERLSRVVVVNLFRVILSRVASPHPLFVGGNGMCIVIYMRHILSFIIVSSLKKNSINMNMRQRQLHEHFAMIRSRFLRSAFFVCTLIDFRNFSSLLRNFNLFSLLFASELVAFNLFARHAMNQYWMSSFWWRSCSLWQSANIFIRCVVVYTEMSDSQCRLLVFFSWRFLSSFLSRALARVRLSENFIYIHSKFVSAKRKNITNNSFSSSSSRSSNQQIQIQRQRLNGIVGHLNVFFLHFWLNQFCFFCFVSAIIVQALIARFECICIF